jgi:GntR family transcriptional regulator/MocR family aminotransferase
LGGRSGYFGARGAWTAAGVRCASIPVDAEGLCVAHGELSAPEARMAYVSPSHQYPLGVTMSLPRRMALLAWARRRGAWIAEDDYDSEFRYAGRPLAALQGLDTAGRVIYIGTFSKVLFPALRLGYMVVPAGTVEAFAAARALSDRHPPGPSQALVAEFLAEGHFARHIRRMRTLYAERQAALVSATRREWSGLPRSVAGRCRHAPGRLAVEWHERRRRVPARGRRRASARRRFRPTIMRPPRAPPCCWILVNYCPKDSGGRQKLAAAMIN